MNLTQYMADMQATIPIMEAALSSIGAQEARWKPGPDRWSILEVVNHMADEESEDFRHCVDMLLHSPRRDWPKLETWEWVLSRKYNERDLAESLGRFIVARQESVAWLGGLSSPAWDNLHAGNHPFAEKKTAGDVMVSWVAHDFFHIGQINTLRWEHLNAAEPSFSTVYAGEIYWRPEGIGPAAT
jgi:DinB superfamily